MYFCCMTEQTCLINLKINVVLYNSLQFMFTMYRHFVRYFVAGIACKRLSPEWGIVTIYELSEPL